MLSLGVEIVAILLLTAVIGLLMGRFLCKSGENEEREQKKKVIHAFKTSKNELEISRERVKDQVLQITELEYTVARREQKINNLETKLLSSDKERAELLEELKILEKYKPRFEALDNEFKIQSDLVKNLKSEKISNQEKIDKFQILTTNLNANIENLEKKKRELESEIKQLTNISKQRERESEASYKKLIENRDKAYDKLQQESAEKLKTIIKSKDDAFEKLQKSSYQKYIQLENSKDVAYNKLKQESQQSYNELKKEKDTLYNKLEQESKKSYKELEKEKDALYKKLEQESQKAYNDLKREKNKLYEKLEQKSHQEYKKLEKEKDDLYDKLKHSNKRAYIELEKNKDNLYDKLKHESQKAYNELMNTKDEEYKKLQEEKSKAYQKMVDTKNEAYQQIRDELESIENEYEEFKINYNLDNDRLESLEKENKKIYTTLDTIAHERDDLLARLRAISSVVGAVGVDNAVESGQLLLEN